METTSNPNHIKYRDPHTGEETHSGWVVVTVGIATPKGDMRWSRDANGKRRYHIRGFLDSNGEFVTSIADAAHGTNHEMSRWINHMNWNEGRNLLYTGTHWVANIAGTPGGWTYRSEAK